MLNCVFKIFQAKISEAVSANAGISITDFYLILEFRDDLYIEDGVYLKGEGIDLQRIMQKFLMSKQD